MPKEWDLYSILTDGGEYRERPYKNEQELERLAIAHSNELFGEDTIYFDIKKQVRSNLRSRVTDGLLLDLTAWYRQTRFFIVEYELSSHNFERDVFPQIRGFLKALKDPRTSAEIMDLLYPKIKDDSSTQRMVQRWYNRTPGVVQGDEPDTYFLLRNLLQGETGVLVVVDKVTPEVTETLGDFENMVLMEFRTFEREGKLAHLVNPLHAPPSVSREERPAFAAPMKASGETTIRQILQVVANMRSGKTYSAASRLVATQRGITQQSVRDKTTRKLGLSKAQFVRMFEEGSLATLLVKKYPSHKEVIESELSM